MTTPRASQSALNGVTSQPTSIWLKSLAHKIRHPNYLYRAVVMAMLAPVGVSTAQASERTNADSAATDLFFDCASLQLDAARLACYDKVASKGESLVPDEKRPLDIVKSVQASFNERKPKLVLASDTDAQTDVSTQTDTPTADKMDTIASGHDNTLGNLADNDNGVNTSQLEDKIDTLYLTQNAQNDDSQMDNQASNANDDSRTLSKVGVTQEQVQKYTPLSLAYDLDKNSELGVWSARPYYPMYLMPVFITADANRAPKTPTQEAYPYTIDEYQPLELKAQVSLKTKVAQDLFDTNADLWFGYTQQMHWQVYNEDNSRPFRANDYMPEVFITQPVKAHLPYYGELRMLGAGVIHHSNGQSDPLSRSWNRIYLMGGAEWGNLSVMPRAWIHVKKETDADPSDNPDITDYYGYGDIKALYDLGKGETIAATGRLNPVNGKGAIQLDYTYPFDEDVHGFLQIFHGYGESLIDYNHSSTSVGVGVTLSDWKGL